MDFRGESAVQIPGFDKFAYKRNMELFVDGLVISVKWSIGEAGLEYW